MEFSSERKRKNQVVAHNLRSTHSAQAPAQRLRARARCYRGAQVWVAATAITRGGRERSIWWRERREKKTNNKKIRKPVCSYLYRWPTVLEFGLSLRCLEHLYDYSLNMLHFYPHDQAGPSSLTGFTFVLFFFFNYLFVSFLCLLEKKVCNTHCVCTQSVVGCRIQPRNVPEATAACQTDLKANPREARCRGTCKFRRGKRIIIIFSKYGVWWVWVIDW